MKRLAALLPILLVGCTSQPKAEDFSFQLRAEVINSSLEKKDEVESYGVTCGRSGTIVYKLAIQPEDFTGSVFFKSAEKVGEWVSEESYDTYINVIDGVMVPLKYELSSFKGSTLGVDDEKRHKALCDMKKASSYFLVADYSTVVMTPGFHPVDSSTD